MVHPLYWTRSTVKIEWLGQWRRVEVIANEGRLPLLGIGLLRGRRLTIDYETNELELE